MSEQSSRLALALVLPLVLSCNSSLNGDGGNGDGGTRFCAGRGCNINFNCPVLSGPTTLTGVVNIPSGKLPVYNAKVYIPAGDPPEKPTSGATCDRCDQVVPLDAAAQALTDVNGAFVLKNVPSGQNIPLVVRVGKWQRVAFIDNIPECATTAVDPEKTRLPKTQAEGNIPRIAVTTGQSDAMECILREKKLGILDSEFTNSDKAGRVNLYVGAPLVDMSSSSYGADRYASTLNGGAFFPDGVTWWNTSTANPFSPYDIVMFSCEGSTNGGQKSKAAHDNLHRYLNAGGRVFASHWHNSWIADATTPAPPSTEPALSKVADFVPDTYGYQNDDPAKPDTDIINQSFAKGKALADWMQLSRVGGSTKAGEFPVRFARDTLKLLDTNLAQNWVNLTMLAGTAGLDGAVLPASQYFSFNTPLDAQLANQCGQMVFTDMHISGALSSTDGDISLGGSGGTPFPSGCTATDLTSQEKALIFLLFDLTNCLQTTTG